MTDFDNAQHDLGRELVAAGHRLQAQKRSPALAGPFARLALPVMAGVLLIAGIVGVSTVLVTAPASATVFEITELADRTELAVIDIITTPDEVEQQLINELQLPSELYALPAHPALVGKILSAGTTGDIAPAYHTQPDFTVDTITLNKGFNGKLIIEYGRQAAPGETYTATIPDPLCAQLWGQTLNQTLPIIEPLADTIQYETVNADHTTETNTNPETIDPDYGLTDISYTSTNSLILTYAANPDTQPRTHPNCQ